MLRVCRPLVQFIPSVKDMLCRLYTLTNVSGPHVFKLPSEKLVAVTLIVRGVLIQMVFVQPALKVFSRVGEKMCVCVSPRLRWLFPAADENDGSINAAK